MEKELFENLETLKNENLSKEKEYGIEKNIVTPKLQNQYLDNILGKSMNFAIDIGLRAVLPDLLEDAVIGVKDILLKEGLNEGINTIIDSAINIGKGAIGILTGNFENISQVQAVLNKGGVLENTSKLLDTVIDKARKNNNIDRNTAQMIKKGKNIILDNVSKNIENTLSKQINSIEKINKYEENWIKYYENKDFYNMEKEFNKLEKELKEIIPLEKTIKKARIIENVHNLIKNKEEKFNLTQQEIEIAKKLA